MTRRGRAAAARRRRGPRTPTELTIPHRAPPTRGPESQRLSRTSDSGRTTATSAFGAQHPTHGAGASLAVRGGLGDRTRISYEGAATHVEDDSLSAAPPAPSGDRAAAPSRRRIRTAGIVALHRSGPARGSPDTWGRRQARHRSGAAAGLASAGPGAQVTLSPSATSSGTTAPAAGSHAGEPPHVRRGPVPGGGGSTGSGGGGNSGSGGGNGQSNQGGGSSWGSGSGASSGGGGGGGATSSHGNGNSGHSGGSGSSGHGSGNSGQGSVGHGSGSTSATSGSGSSNAGGSGEGCDGGSPAATAAVAEQRRRQRRRKRRRATAAEREPHRRPRRGLKQQIRSAAARGVRHAAARISGLQAN